MSNIIDFEDEKINRDLIDSLTKIEPYLPTQEEIEKDLQEIKDKYDFHYTVNDPSYLTKVHEVLNQTFSELVEVFKSFDSNSEFSRKQYLKKLKAFDTSRILLDEYISSRYEIADDPVPELDKCLEIVNDNYVKRTESELKADIERYIPMVDKMYDIVFRMLQNNDSRCSSLDMYMIMMSGICFHPFNAYRTAYTRTKNREDQSV